LTLSKLESNVTDVDSEAISALRALAEQAEAVADGWTPDSDSERSAQYAALRDQAWLLAERHGFSDAVEFSHQFPSTGDLAVIGDLDEQWALTTSGPNVDRTAWGSPLQRALRDLAAWAIGVRTAGELHL
jgi:hypothetical protein